MGRVNMSGGGSSVDLDVITTGAGDIVKGKVGVDKDGEPVTGTLALSGDATEAYVYNGKTFYSTDPKVKKTGGMTVNSLLSFSLAVISGRKVTASWGNPRQASGKPYSGVYIRYSTSGNPGKTGGTQIYKGAGSNTASGGTSTATFSLPNLNTKYYLSIYPYVTCSAGEMTGDVLNATVTTGGEQSVTCTSSKNVIVPDGYTLADIFCVGGGGRGDSGMGSNGDYFGGGGGGGGYTKTVFGVTVSSGQSLAVVVGAGSTVRGKAGGVSSVSQSSSMLCVANGGDSQSATYHYYAGNGGSGGGAGGSDSGSSSSKLGGNGGADGAGGTNGGSSSHAGKGQGTTTRAWGSLSGTLYAGGGGGGGGGVKQDGTSIGQGGSGGSGGGGAGGRGGTNGNIPVAGIAGSANTGGGGGGGGGGVGYLVGGNGGSGIVLIRFK